jgi:hypothetical protein
MFRRIVIAFAGFSLFSGCAIHPLPEDVTGVSTYHIVRQIRCETRDTVRKIVIKWLSRLDDPLAQKLAAQYESDPASIRGFSYKLFNTPALVRVRDMAKLFYDTGIAYNFNFDITENNDLSTNISFLRGLPHSVFSLDAGAGAKRKRENQRVFTVTDTFGFLLTQVPEKYCEGFVVDAHYVYPITGRIGVDKLVTDFIDLTLFGALAGTQDKPDGPPTMVDNLTFTTTVSASATPKIAFTPVGDAFHLASADFTASADRTDAHSVAVGLAIATGDAVELDPIRLGLLAPKRAGLGPARNGLVVGRRITGGGSPSERLAVAAIDQFKSQDFRIVPAQ